jgi:hypothetical protein
VKASVTKLLIPTGTHRDFSIAGLGIEFQSKLSTALPFVLEDAFRSFETPESDTHLRVEIGSRSSFGPHGRLLHEPRFHWRFRHDPSPGFEFYHPPSSRIHLTAQPFDDFRRCEILFDERVWRRSYAHSPVSRPFVLYPPYPLDQLLFLPVLARHGGFLVHACGAVLNGKAFVFAGHSGDGKTTLARLLASEGLELLSDERIAVRKQGDTFWAYGTPWHGEGKVVSSSCYPLAGVFVLKKARRHRVVDGRPSVLAAELLSRSIVPYYFPEETAHILGLVRDIATTVPLRELEFSVSSGLLPILSQAA